MSAFTPKVSVSVLAYQHVRYIARALDSVLAQRVDFPLEIIVGDDYSTDGTRELLKDYERRYPDTIFAIYHPRRYDCIPGRINNLTNLYACRGTYIAMLDGDDYWTDPDKLQRQVDYLDAHPEVAITFHDVMILTEGDSGTPPRRFSEVVAYLQSGRREFSHTDITLKWFTPTSSLVYRNHLLGELPPYFWQVISADHILLMLLSQHGNLYYFPEAMGIYRVHAHSFVNRFQYREENLLQKLQEIDIVREQFGVPYTAHDYRYHRAIVYLKLLRLKWRERHVPGVAHYALRSVTHSPWLVGQRLLHHLRRLGESPKEPSQP